MSLKDSQILELNRNCPRKSLRSVHSPEIKAKTLKFGTVVDGIVQLLLKKPLKVQKSQNEAKFLSKFAFERSKRQFCHFTSAKNLNMRYNCHWKQ